eukprot:GDKJ01062248.1.p1 GENE.GDKJ01062248.1~~GDKJ01062248.1.p1  ORF type:complete len:216 (-),score=51.86 GDKJ01062248.1:49-696(-)
MFALRRLATRSCVSSIANRAFSRAQDNLVNLLKTEISLESKQPAPIVVQDFVKNNKDWSFSADDGQVSLKLKKNVERHDVTVEWQCAHFYADSGAVSTDFRVLIESSDSKGIVFYCRTYTGSASEQSAGELYSRFSIDTVRTFSSTMEKEDLEAYSGPSFADLSDEIQNAFDQYLEAVGVNDSLCDFIDSASMYKEQKEFVRWLSTMKDFFENCK